MAGREVVPTAIGVAMGLVLALVASTVGYGVLAVYVVALPVLTVIHEAAHAGVAALVGSPPIAVLLFGTRRTGTFDLGTILVVLGRNTFGGGLTMHRPPVGRWARCREAAFVFAGPTSGAVIGAVAWAAAPADGSGRAVALGIVLAAAQLTIVNLLPQQIATPWGSMASDGLQLIRLPRKQVDEAVQLRLRARVEAYRWALREDHERAADVAEAGLEPSDGPELLAEVAHYALLADRLDTARDLILRAVKHSDLADWAEDDRAGAYNTAAWVHLLRGDQASLDEAERYAAMAFDVAPSPAAQDNLGWVALGRGRCDEAHRLFIQAFEGTRDASYRAIISVGLARATAVLGDAELAAAWERVADDYAGSADVIVPPVNAPADSDGAAGGDWSRMATDLAALDGSYRKVARQSFDFRGVAVVLTTTLVVIAVLTLVLIAAL